MFYLCSVHFQVFLSSRQCIHLRKFHTQIQILSFAQNLCDLTTLPTCPISEISGNEEAAA